MSAIRFTLITATLIVAVSTLLGLAAAILGGALVRLGSGPGGLYGLPLIGLLVLVIIGVGGAVPVLASARRDVVRAAPSVAGPILVLVAFLQMAHAMDPCSGGMWDATSRIGDAALCERFSGELNVQTRFHLLLHALAGIPAVALYWLAFRRTRPRAAEPPVIKVGPDS
ncbi:MAG: hypothetical protein ACRDGT_01555 [Candidatus Limnocylindria bacterium]